MNPWLLELDSGMRGSREREREKEKKSGEILETASPVLNLHQLHSG